MNPTTLNVDPDPEFRPDLDTDPGLPVCRYRYSVLKEKMLKIDLLLAL